MKKVLLFAALSLLAALLVSCSDDNGTDDPVYTITVSTTGNGTVSASAESVPAGTTVTLTATPEEDFSFLHWTVLSGNIILSDETSSMATFTMPERNVSIRAEFAENTGDGEENKDEKLVKQIVRDYVTEEFKYDNERRLIRVDFFYEDSDYNQSVEYIYNGNTITVQPTNGSTETYTLDSEGRLQKNEYAGTDFYMEYEYDASGYLKTRAEVSGSQTDNRFYTWDNGNITRYDRDDMNIYVTYTYLDRENKLSVQHESTVDVKFIRFKGMTSKNLIDEETWHEHQYEHKLEYTAKYNYTYDSDGYPEKIETVYTGLDAEKQVITISYY